MKKKNGWMKLLIIFAAVVLVVAGAFFIYVFQYYKADASALEVYKANSDSIVVKKDYTCFYPDKDKDLKKAYIFYPGGKVEETAYAPILEKLAREGLTCILIKMPYRLAVLDINAADSVFKDFPEIEWWYIGGHSLGGAMAGSYAAKHTDKLDGMILLAAYPAAKTDIPALILYGSEDKVLKREKLKGLTGLQEITGGNHAQFGNYGTQAGDGTAFISSEEQQYFAVKAIMDFILKIS